MGNIALPELAKKMKDIDFAMLFTKAPDGSLAGRPMSNNGDVEYQGDSFFFSLEQTHTVREIERDPKVALSFSGSKGLLGTRPLFIAVEGNASLIRDKESFSAHWTKDLDRWFDDGIDTPGIVLIKVRATRIHYWDGQDEGELEPSSAGR